MKADVMILTKHSEMYNLISHKYNAHMRQKK